jgi:hypothetical protein
MKAIKNLLTIVLISLFSGQALAQAPQMFLVHEDRVKPSKVMEYEQLAKQLVEGAREHNMEVPGWITVSMDDMRYMYVSPLSSMSEMDKDPWSPFREKMGPDSFDQMMSSMDQCYDSHGDYILLLHPDLSYMPDGMTQTPEGQDYRGFYYVKTTPSQLPALIESMKKIKDMFASKNSKSYYRVYSSGFGNMETYLMVAVAAQDEISYAQEGKENNELLGQEGYEVFGKMMNHITSMEEVRGRMRPDLAYSPGK